MTTYEHLRTHEEDFDIDRDALEDDGWEIIAVSQGMIYWKKAHHSDFLELLSDDDGEKSDEYNEGGWIYPTTPTIPWPSNPYVNPWTPVKPNEIYVTFNNTNTNSELIVQAIADKLAQA